MSKLENQIYQNEIYSFPEKAKFKINNEETELPVTWKTTKIDASKLGDFVFEGVADQYERPIKLILHITAKIVSTEETSTSIIQGQGYKLPLVVSATFSDQTIKEVYVKWFPQKVDISNVGTQNFIGTIVNYEKKIKMQVIVKPKPIVYSKQIGYISETYEENGKRYLRYDDVIFLTGDAAVQASIKNGTAQYENGEYYVDDDYCIINNNPETKRYVISNDASINLMGWVLYPDNGDINNHPTTYATFKKCLSNNYGRLLCYIYTQNDVIVKVEGQYVP
ncbi:MAG: Ig-like domain-containing protein [Clostridium sp.]|uniref:Ig-like domain-containing protein n=1 Tax=Clostridium sp. TaxID=1506 RepID=UPI003D6D42D7